MDIDRIPTKRLQAAIDQLADADMRRLVELRYVRGLAVKEVRAALDLPHTTYYRLHGQALEILEGILSHEDKVQLDLLLSRFNVTIDSLVGIRHLISSVTEAVTLHGEPWITSIEGIGGIGKTTLAAAVTQAYEMKLRFERVIWVSAKQEYWHGSSNRQTHPAMLEDDLVEKLSEKIGLSLDDSKSERRKQLIEYLKSIPLLVVIDNLETVTDYESILPLLRALARPSKVLITSRHSLRNYSDIRCITLDELSFANAVMLLKDDAERRSLAGFEQITKSQLEDIYNVTGGNPLALRLVIGQLSMLPLPVVLDSLKQADGQDIEAMYNFIYWRAWNMLDACAQQLLLVMPLTNGGNFEQLVETALLAENEVNSAIQQLTKLSLIHVTVKNDVWRYSIHRLTEVFLMKEALRWKGELCHL